MEQRIDADRADAPVIEPPEVRTFNPRTVRDWADLYVSSAWHGRHLQGLSGIETFCFFIGYGRSGHSLIGSLLNAHADITISHELDALRFVQKHFRRNQIYSLILSRDRAFGHMDRTWTGYDYRVPNQHQGDYSSIKVIGDKRGGASSERLGRHPEVLNRLRRTVKVPIRVIHVTRNPFDIITTNFNRTELSFPENIAWFEECCRSVADIKALLEPSELMDVSHEDFVDQPSATLGALCTFLGVSADQQYLEDCTSILWPSAQPSRHRVEWSVEDRKMVEGLIARYDFLHQYSFDA